MARKTTAKQEEQHKESWLSDHLSYELKMLRHTFRRMMTVPQPEYRDFNAFHSAFCTSLRNIAAFLTNAEGRNNFKASDFVPGFRSRKGNLAKKFEKFEPQVFHLGKSRPTGSLEKFDLYDAHDLYAWGEKEIGKFIAALPKHYAEKWRDDRAILEETWKRPTTLEIKALVQTACTADPIVAKPSTFPPSSGPVLVIRNGSKGERDEG